MKRIFCIRHGESEANAGLRTSDPARIPLTRVGQKQAKDVARRFPEEPRLIVTSSYLRARQTARPLMEQYPNAVCEEWPAHEFTYLSPAKCQNTTQADRSSSVTSYWKRNDPFYCDGAGAESFTDLIGRATDVIARLRECEGPVIAIFSHQQFIAALQWINESGGRMSSARMRDFKCFLNARSLENGGILQLVM